MSLFYGKNKWTGKTDWLNSLSDAEESAQSALPQPSLFKSPKALPNLQEDTADAPIDNTIDPSQLPQVDSPQNIPNYQKRMAEDQPLAGRLFSERGKTSAGTQEDPAIPQSVDAQRLDEPKKPSLFGPGQPQMDDNGIAIPQRKKIGAIQAFLANIIPGIQGRESAEEQYKTDLDAYKTRVAASDPTSDIKTFSAYSKMTPEDQKKYLEMKTASSMATSPLDMMKFQETVRNHHAEEDIASNKLTPEQVKKNAAKDQGNGLLKSLDDLDATLDQVDVGTAVPSIVGGVKQSMASHGYGADKDAITSINSLTQGIKMQYGRDFSGKYNNTEGEEIAKNLLPLLNKPKSQRKAAIAAAKTLVKNKFFVDVAPTEEDSNFTDDDIDAAISRKQGLK